MTQSAHRHCQCGVHLGDIICAAIEKQGQQNHETLKPLYVHLKRNRGRVMSTCPGTTLPEVNWAAVDESVRKMLLAGMHALILEEKPVLAVEGYAKKLATSVARSIASMWKFSLEGPPPDKAAKIVRPH
jgi:hypothetical protein